MHHQGAVLGTAHRQHPRTAPGGLRLDVNIMEFISLEHTPKNILIKAVRNGRPDRQKYQEYLAFAKDWQIRPYLEEELARIGRIPERQD